MSDFWKPTIIAVTMMIMFGALYLKHPTRSDAANTAAASLVSPDEIMRSAGLLPATVIDAFQ